MASSAVSSSGSSGATSTVPTTEPTPAQSPLRPLGASSMRRSSISLTLSRPAASARLRTQARLSASESHGDGLLVHTMSIRLAESPASEPWRGGCATGT